MKENNKIRNWFSAFYILSLIEGIASFIVLMGFPGSRSRTLIAVVIGVGLLVFLGLTAGHWFFSRHLDAFWNRLISSDRASALLFGFGVSAFVFGLFFWSVTILSYTYVMEGFLERLAPLLLWLMALGLQLAILVLVIQEDRSPNIKNGLGIAASTLSIILLAGAIYIANTDPDFYFDLNREDHFVEWSTVLFLSLSAFIALGLAIRKQRKGDRFSVFFYIFGIVLVLFTLEEISWGQRIFGIKSNEFFLEYSNQQETNIHNVLSYLSGLQTKDIAAVALTIFGVLLPILAINQRIRNWLVHYRLVIPTFWTATLFLLGAVLMVDPFSGHEEEIGELLLSMGLFFFALLAVFPPASRESR